MVLFPTVLRWAPTPAPREIHACALGSSEDQPPVSAAGGWSQVHPSRNSPRGPEPQPFLLTFAARSPPLQDCKAETRTHGPSPADALSVTRVPEASRAHGSGLSASVCCSAVAAAVLLLPLVLASAALDSQFPCLCRQNASPQGSDLSIQCFYFLRHAFGGCLEGSWICLLGWDLDTKLSRVSQHPRAQQCSPSNHRPHFLFGLVLSRFIKTSRGMQGPQADALGGFADGSACQDPTLAEQGRRVPVSSLTLHHQGSGGNRAQGPRRVLCCRPTVVRTVLSIGILLRGRALRGVTRPCPWKCCQGSQVA